ncbi:MAG: TonB-dependent siderophore receptor [Verrucomicrobiota bacterium]
MTRLFSFLALFWISGAAPLIFLSPLAAQEQDTATDTSETTESAPNTQTFDIPSQSLSEALKAYSAQTGIDVGANSNLLNGKTAPAVSGDLTAEAALNRLLAGSGLRPDYIGPNSVAISDAPVPELEDGEVPRLDQTVVDAQDVVTPPPAPVVQQTPVAPILEETVNEPVVIDDVGFRVATSSAALNIAAPPIQTPATVNSLSSDFINTVQPTNLAEYLDYVPGANSNEQGPGSAGFGNQFSIRGFQAGSVLGNSLLIDGFVAPRVTYHFDRAVFEQADVLKGASSVLYGPAAPGGNLVYTTKKPEFTPGGSVETTVGSDDLKRGVFDLTGPVGNSDKVAFRLITVFQDANRSFDGDSGVLFPDDLTIINPQLTWKTPTGGTLHGTWDYSKRTTFDPFGGTYFLFNPGGGGQWLFNRNYSHPESVTNLEQQVGRISYTQPLMDGWELFLGSSMNRETIDSRFGAANPIIGVVTTAPLPFASGIISADTIHNEHRVSVNGNFNTGSAIEHNLTIGRTVADTVSDRETFIGTTFGPILTIDPVNPVFAGPLPPPDGLPFFTTGPVNAGTNFFYDESRTYIQDYVTINDTLHFFGGLSYLDYRAGRTVSLGRSFATEDQVLNESAGMIYNGNEWFNPFVTYSNSTQVQTGLLRSGGLLPARDSAQIEAGIKSEWFDGRLLTTASVFEIEQTNIGENDPANLPGENFQILVGDTKTKGFEFEAVGRITDQLGLFLGYSYLDTIFTESVLAGRQGNTQFGVPKDKISAYLTYEFGGALEGWSLGGGVIHVGDRWFDNENTLRLPTYERYDMSVSYQKGSFRVLASIQNLADEDYVAGSSGSFLGGVTQGRKRFFQLTASWDFEGTNLFSPAQ